MNPHASLLKTYLYDWHGWNLRLFHVINHLHRPWLDNLMQWTASISAPDWMWAYCLAVYLWALALTWPARKAIIQTAVMARFTAVATLLLGGLLARQTVASLNTVFHYPSPLTVLGPHKLHALGHLPWGSSFPSQPAAFATLLAVALWPVLRIPGRILLVAFAGSVMLSNIVCGAYFPADVVAGGCIGTLLTLFIRDWFPALTDRIAHLLAWPVRRFK